MKKQVKTDVVIVGTGVSGLFCALHLPEDKAITIITKSDLESNDSFLAQGGICVLPEESDYASFFEDTMKAGHYENRKESVDLMIRSSPDVIKDLVKFGVSFTRDEKGNFVYTKEGAHARPRILFHEDITGKEITSQLLKEVKKRKNITLLEYTTMTDLLVQKGTCVGLIASTQSQEELSIQASYTILACGGVGGLYKHSTNYPHLTGDGITLAQKYHIEVEHLDYIQIHPTTLYSTKKGRRFLISESVRGEGAVLYNKDKQRFTDELQPRDVVTQAIHKQMEKDHTDFVWLSMEKIPKETILSHFPHIYQHCLEEGFDVTKECIPVVPAQHYFMGGIHVDRDSKTSMDHLFAVGETSCNGVHGANRLASNSLLESLVFAKRAARKMREEMENSDVLNASLCDGKRENNEQAV